MRAVAAILASLTLATGCTTSRWAMGDAEYATKYAGPYEEGEKLERMAKQAIDARHVAGKFGAFGGVATGNGALTGELGLFLYRTPCLEYHASLSGLAKRTGPEVNGYRPYRTYGVVGLGVRAQTPTRLAPFVGANVLAGSTQDELRSTNSTPFHVIDDGDYEAFAAFAPEAGVHFWLTHELRVTTSARYHVSSLGRDDDFWTIGTSLSLLLGGGSVTPVD